ncbi:hypothetical protein, partial [Nostoc sp. CHAB 5715]|uniref:hypothetical protein n=1 Tax=Nostoc sp. CHAB 5715 TaxID=2780400 RepID=UPI001E33826B
KFLQINAFSRISLQNFTTCPILHVFRHDPFMGFKLGHRSNLAFTSWQNVINLLYSPQRPQRLSGKPLTLCVVYTTFS